jgi:hypothetical protein
VPKSSSARPGDVVAIDGIGGLGQKRAQPDVAVVEFQGAVTVACSKVCACILFPRSRPSRNEDRADARSGQEWLAVAGAKPRTLDGEHVCASQCSSWA